MQLNLQQITAATRGAVCVEQQTDGFHFSRFTKSEQDMYNQTKFADKHPSTAGISLEFDTDATALSLAITEQPASSRKYFAMDVFANGEYVGSIRNFEDGNKACGYAGREYTVGDFEGTFSLGQGSKRVRVLFPWSAKCVLRRAELTDATFFAPAPARPKMLLYGDSITHGVGGSGFMQNEG